MKTINPGTQVFGGDDRQLFRIIVCCLSLAFAALIASLETVRATSTGFWFEVSWRTALTFGLALAVMLPCFNMVFHSRSMGRRWFGLASVALTGVFGFFYPLRFVPSEKYGMLFTGLAIAVVALSCVAGMIFNIARFLEADEHRHEENTHD